MVLQAGILGDYHHPLSTQITKKNCSIEYERKNKAHHSLCKFGTASEQQIETNPFNVCESY